MESARLIIMLRARFLASLARGLIANTPFTRREVNVGAETVTVISAELLSTFANSPIISGERAWRAIAKVPISA